MRFSIILFTAGLMVQVILLAGICSAQEETTEVEMRLANGVPVEGTFKSAAPEGLTVQSAKGTKILPWKYLSTGTRWRYERPMLAELEAKAKAEADAATINQPKITAPLPAIVVSNKPPSVPAAK